MTPLKGFYFLVYLPTHRLIRLHKGFFHDMF